MFGLWGIGPRNVTIPDGVTITVGALRMEHDEGITITGGATSLLVFDGSAELSVSHIAPLTFVVPVQLAATLTVQHDSTGIVTFTKGVSESGGPHGFVIRGSVRFASSVDNTYTGVTVVESGTLSLGHPNGTKAIQGGLRIGDAYATVRLDHDDQFLSTSDVVVIGAGLLDMTDRTASVRNLTAAAKVWLGAGRLTMASLTIAGGRLLSGSGGRYVLNGDVRVAPSSLPSRIEGPGAFLLNGSTRTFAVADGPDAVDLFVQTPIGGLPGDGLVKTGAGVLRLAGANTYTGPTTVAEGRLQLQHTGGGNTIPGAVTVGDGSGAARSAELRLLAPENIANTASVTVLADGVFNVSNVAETVGTLTVMGGVAELGNAETGRLAMAGLILSGGILQTGAPGSQFVLNGDVVATSGIGSAIIGGPGALSLNGATRMFAVSDGPHATDLRIDVAITRTGSEGLTKSGAGVALLTGNNTYTGATTVAGGGLFIAGQQPQSAVNVTGAGSILGGTGTVGDITVSAGAVSPGLSPGALRCRSFSVNAAASLSIELDGPRGGTGYDRVQATGTVQIGGAILDLTAGFAPPPGSQFTILENDGADPIGSTFAGLPEGATLTAGGRELAVSYVGGDGNDIVLTTTAPVSYFLAEGATGSFFDEDVVIANANNAAAFVTLAFLMEGGSMVVEHRTVPARSRITVHVDAIAGLETTAPSVQVTCDNGLPLIVERSMFWDTSYYGGHTANAVGQPELSWVFAEGSQGFFDTYVLLANANAAMAAITLTFLREADPPVVRTYQMAPFSRRTVYAGDVPEVVGRSFGMLVEATLPVIAERSMYFGSRPGRLWSGGHVNTGATEPSTSWLHAEGATGTFFNTFILLSNPQATVANVEMRFLLDTGEVITMQRVVGARERLTINPAAEGEPRLTNAAFATVVTSDVPIVSERSMYWPGEATPFGEGHNSLGVVTTGTTWGLAEGRVGGPQQFLTYILLANPASGAAEVTITYLREGAAPVVKTYTVPPTSRYNVDVGLVVPELQHHSFGAKIEVTNGIPIAVERSLYWTANNVFWAGGSNTLATAIP